MWKSRQKRNRCWKHVEPVSQKIQRCSLWSAWKSGSIACDMMSSCRRSTFFAYACLRLGNQKSKTRARWLSLLLKIRKQRDSWDSTESAVYTHYFEPVFQIPQRYCSWTGQTSALGAAYINPSLVLHLLSYYHTSSVSYSKTQLFQAHVVFLLPKLYYNELMCETRLKQQRRSTMSSLSAKTTPGIRHVCLRAHRANDA